MGKVRRSRTLGVAPERVWELIDDPHHLPRWWPGVRRLEGVHEGRWTEVYLTRKGHTVRIDLRLLDSMPPGTDGPGGAGRRRWEQEVAGTPFERVLRESITEVRVQAARAGEGTSAGGGAGAGAGCEVTIEERQKLRGYSRLVGFMLARASGRRLEQALDGLERALV